VLDVLAAGSCGKFCCSPSVPPLLPQPVASKLFAREPIRLVTAPGRIGSLGALTCTPIRRTIATWPTNLSVSQRV
jgi:hypothetical protein